MLTSFFARANDSIKVREKVLFQNDICIPRTVYMLSDLRNNIFIEPLLKRWRPYNDFVRFTGNAKYSRRLEKVASIDNPQNSDTIVTQLINSDDFKTNKTIISALKIGKKGYGTEEVIVQILGDSYVNGAFFKDALLTQNYVPHIKLIGLRKIQGEDRQYDEGRGGWKLEDYFKIPTGEYTSYHGYIQPEGDYRYWVATAFWKRCYKVIKGEVNDFGSTYHCSRFDDYVIKFDERTGYLIKPSKNDIQYDNQLKSFVKYNGKSWIPVNEVDFNWIFDYGKYLEMWDLPRPRFFAEMLGLNDFRYHMDNDFTLWNKRIDIMKNSYLKAVPNGKFIIMIPSSTCGVLNNANGDFTTQQNASMWQCRKNIIDTFDNREKDGYYIVDTGITIDNEKGYNTDEAGVQTGNPHPYPNYPNMGAPLAGFIQYYR
jgi:hypothetical protein